MNWREPVGDELTVYSSKIKSFEYPNNKSANDQSVSHNISELKNIRLQNANNIIITQVSIHSSGINLNYSHIVLVVILTYL